ncbi:amp dependent CoA ligase [Laetiporus sulphureus 93-53]|uniref:Amp dependent CoA ligase n=1 Tax=Laetiporus sulphureus 93-53 TaxID=1314785 RepID=A0A165F1N6_9APHY|nr:amp dependent CoA ligase [Laetiporus sulphureus 93-53]KZT08184.1 amp dependent CoA ligase [Laetiporus sulphureus 93-53]
MEFVGPASDSLPHIPDDLTCAQFMLDEDHSARPVAAASQTAPWMIEDATGRKIAHSEVRERTKGLANALSLRWGISEDDVVCIFSPNHVDYPVAIWAVHRLGAIITAANPSYLAGELEYQLTATKAKLMIVHSWSLAVALDAARLAGIPPERIVLLDSPSQQVAHVTVDELVKEGLSKPLNFVERRLKPGEGRTKLAFLSFSSGTTGRPKAVCISHYAPIANVIQMSHLANLQTGPLQDRKWRVGDVVMAVLPFFHIYGLVVVMHFTIFYGSTLVVVPKFNFVDFLKSIERHRVGFLPIVPPMVVLLCKHPAVKQYDLSTVHAIMSGAAPLSAELTKQLSELLPQASIGQGYGMTETSTTVSFPQVEQKICTPGSAGRLLPGITARVVKEDGSLAGYNESGELFVKGPAMALRYLNNEEATKETFIDGWVCTGDEVKINESMEVFVVDRIKELIKVRGFQVAPAELEGHLLEHPDISDVCVVGLPDDYSGELPLAFIALNPIAIERVQQDPREADKIKDAIIKHVADAKVHYKRLAAGVEFIEVIPKNPSGKLLRRVLRDKAKEMMAQGKLSKPVKARL